MSTVNVNLLNKIIHPGISSQPINSGAGGSGAALRSAALSKREQYAGVSRATWPAVSAVLLLSTVLYSLQLLVKFLAS